MQFSKTERLQTKYPNKFIVKTTRKLKESTKQLKTNLKIKTEQNNYVDDFDNLDFVLNEIQQFENKLKKFEKKGFSWMSRQQSIMLKDSIGYRSVQKIKNHEKYPYILRDNKNK